MDKQRTELQKIQEIGQDLWFCMVDVDQLHEQDVNARMMDDNMMKQLAANIGKRGQIESVPFCCEKDGKLEIISGHHRVKASKMAGVSPIPILLDTSGLNRSQIAAKQLAHNSINGFDDEDMLKEIAKMINNVDDMLESYFNKEFDIEPIKIEPMAHVKTKLDFKQISLVFLDNQIDDAEKFLKQLEQNPQYIGVADGKDFDDFCERLKKTQKVMDVRNISAAVSAMIDMCSTFFKDNGYAEKMSWVPVSKILGGATCSKDTADIIKKAVEKMVKDGVAHSKWEAMGKLAEDYLNG